MMMVGVDNRRARCDRCRSMHYPAKMVYRQNYRYCSEVCRDSHTPFGIPTPRSAA